MTSVTEPPTRSQLNLNLEFNVYPAAYASRCAGLFIVEARGARMHLTHGPNLKNGSNPKNLIMTTAQESPGAATEEQTP